MRRREGGFMSFLTKFERWDPFDELTMLRNRMDRLWSRALSDEEPMLAEWAPTSDIIETKDEITIKAELPGIEEKDIDVEIAEGILTIKGERKAEEKTEDKGYHRIERSYGKFLRTYTLSPNVETDKISADFRNGVLNVHLPKKVKKLPAAVKVEVNRKLASAA
jgi:HSP20 family protein